MQKVPILKLTKQIKFDAKTTHQSPIYINALHIVKIDVTPSVGEYTDEKHNQITLIDNNYVFVKETPEEIYNLIKQL